MIANVITKDRSRILYLEQRVEVKGLGGGGSSEDRLLNQRAHMGQIVYNVSIDIPWP